MTVILAADPNLLGTAISKYRLIMSDKVSQVNGTVSMTGFASNDTIAQLRNDGVTVTIELDATGQWLSATEPVVTGNAFADGSIPAGIGVRIGGDV